jgi:hypothetical protein
MKKCLLTSLAVLATSTILAQVPAGPSRPSGVPEGYVITPFGYYHQSCVQTTKVGDTLLASGMIQHADGSKTGGNPCSHPSYAADGTQKDPNPKAETPKVAVVSPVVPQANGWMESASVVADTGHSYSGVTSTNTVPKNPANDEGQTLFYFPGLQDVNDPTTSILQPVLEYNNHAWTMTNWNCCINGVTTHGTSINVSPGDNLTSTISQTCGAKTLSCGTWNLLSVDLTTTQSTTFSQTPSDGQVFNWALGGVLEVYGVNLCTDFPKKAEKYHSIVFDEKLKAIKPKWTVATNSTDTPQCGYNVVTKGDDVTLDYVPGTPVPISFTVSPLTDTVVDGAYGATGSSPVTVTVTGATPSKPVVITIGAPPTGVTMDNLVLDGVVVDNYTYTFTGTQSLQVVWSATNTAIAQTVTIPIIASIDGQSPVEQDVALTVSGPPPTVTVTPPTANFDQYGEAELIITVSGLASGSTVVLEPATTAGVANPSTQMLFSDLQVYWLGFPITPGVPQDTLSDNATIATFTGNGTDELYIINSPIVSGNVYNFLLVATPMTGTVAGTQFNIPITLTEP